MSEEGRGGVTRKNNMEISFLGLEAEGLILVRQKADLAVDIMEVKAVREITGQCDLFHFLVKHTAQFLMLNMFAPWTHNVRKDRFN